MSIKVNGLLLHFSLVGSLFGEITKNDLCRAGMNRLKPCEPILVGQGAAMALVLGRKEALGWLCLLRVGRLQAPLTALNVKSLLSWLFRSPIATGFHRFRKIE